MANSRAARWIYLRLSQLGLLVSRDDVLWCYHYLLGREPESESDLLSKIHYRSFRALAQSFTDSPEYLQGRTVSREDVLWCYEHILGRAPESEIVLLSKMHYRSFRALAQSFTDSPEYLQGRTVSREDVLWCYEHVLARAPESESVLLSKMHYRSFRALAQSFTDSPEYLQGRTVSREDVLWCYEHILGRAPESEEAVTSFMSTRDFRSLVSFFLESVEFAGRHPSSSDSPADVWKSSIPPDVFREALFQPLNPQSLTKQDRDYVNLHFERLWHAMNALADLSPSGGRLIDFSARSHFSDAMGKLLPDVEQTGVNGVNYELDDYAHLYGESSFDICLNMEVLEHLIFDPAHMVWSMNRMLKTGGLLFLSTPNAVAMTNALHWMNGDSPTLWNQVIPGKPYYERHNRDWTPSEVVRLLEENGFTVLNVYTRDFYSSSHELLPQHSRDISYLQSHARHTYFGDTICVLASKQESLTGPVRNTWLYADQD
ncbi:methyltransferase domain-containing protein [Synechococcus sp. L2F]|uniref:methyltransferase domain-containing protein n=1 Tax=Synechococcus sp. L2F TaxID=2823739 RepID=UPI0020CB73E3|nr:methyltransferase domain-containing protein [Synechococcus sp. L2F]